MDAALYTDEGLSKLFTSHSRRILEELVRGRLYVDFDDKEVLQILKEYVQILQECIDRKLDHGVYEECLLMSEGLLAHLGKLPDSHEWLSPDWWGGPHPIPTIREIFQGNMNYLTMMWFEHQDTLNQRRPLALLMSPYPDGRKIYNQSKHLFACKLTFEGDDYVYVVGQEFHTQKRI